MPPDTDLEILRKVLTLNIIILIGVSFSAILGIIAFVQSGILLGLADFAIFIFLIGLGIYLRKKQDYHTVALLANIVMGVFYLFLFIIGGVHNTAFLWVLTYPLITLFLLGSRQGALLSIILFILLIFLAVFQYPLGIPAHYSGDILIRSFAVYFSIFVLSYALEKLRDMVQTRLQNANRALDKLNKEHRDTIRKLRHSLDEIKQLQGIIPICSRCKKIRNDEGYWEQVEEYLQDHGDIQFSHAICPQCKLELYPELGKD